MKYQARPYLHLAPVPQGVFVSGPNTEFIITGPAQLYDLVQHCLDQLAQPRTEAELVDAIGDARAGRVVKQLLDLLDDRGLLLRDPEEVLATWRIEFPGTIDFLAQSSDHPAADFDHIRRSRVELRVGSAVTGAAQRTLERTGIGSHPQAATAPPSLLIIEPPETAEVPSVPVIVIWTAETHLVVGPVLTDGGDLNRWQALTHRAGHWAGSEPIPALAQAAAGALAGQLALEYLSNPAARRSGYVLHGADLRIDRLDFDLPKLDPSSALDPSELLATQLAHWKTPWIGNWAPGPRESNLPQLPIALRELHSRPAQSTARQRIFAWGPRALDATITGHLALLRAQLNAPGAGAGPTPEQAWLDATLRLLSGTATASTPIAPVAHWPSDSRSLWRLLEEPKPEVRVCEIPQVSWKLVQLHHPHDGRQAQAWGPSALPALRAALRTSLAQQQIAEVAEAGAELESMNTEELQQVSSAQLADLTQELANYQPHWIGPHPHTPKVVDPVWGDFPLYGGIIAVATSEITYGPRWGSLEPEQRQAWAKILAPLRQQNTQISVNLGWDLNWEKSQWHNRDTTQLSLRIGADEVQLGPLWTAAESGCAGCAEYRERAAKEHPLSSQLHLPQGPPQPPTPTLLGLVEVAIRQLRSQPLQSGELLRVGAQGLRRHRIRRSAYCPICSEEPDTARPKPRFLNAQPSTPGDPTRSHSGRHLATPGTLASAVIDDKYGPITGILREGTVPFAMSMAVHADASAWGHGRARTTAEAEPVAILEVYERLAGFPMAAGIITDQPYTALLADALDPMLLGQHTPEQLQHHTARVQSFTRDTPMDWVWGHDADTGTPILVPAEVGFYQYEREFRRDRPAARAARAAGQVAAKKFFYDCSSGCALGANYEEAALYSLFELAERDAFMISWHRAQPLPQISLKTLGGAETHSLLELIHSRDFDLHLLRATHDIELPIIWALAINRTGGFPASFSSAGSGANPQMAVRGALREIAQLITDRHDNDLSDIEPMLADPWNIQELVHHPRFYMHPDTLPRVRQVLNGPSCSIEEAFPDWPDRLIRDSHQDVRGSFAVVRELFAQAGLDRVILVDQSSVEHHDLGLSVVKAVVPGIVPMCFGLAQQRLLGQKRLAAALHGTAQANRQIPYDPHPFP